MQCGRWLAKWGSAVLLGMIIAGCSFAVPQVTPTIAPTRTPSETPALPPTETPSVTSSASPTPNPSITPTETRTPAPTNTPLPSDTPTSVPTATLTPTETSSPTVTWTATSTETPSPTPTLAPSETEPPTATATWTPSSTPSFTFTPSNMATDTPLPTATFTWTFTPSLTPSETYTPSWTATDTETPTSTFTPSLTPTPTLSDTPVPTATDTPSNTPTRRPPTALPNIAPTAIPTDTATVTDTPVPTSTLTPSLTLTASELPSFTPFPSQTPEPATFTPVPSQTPVPPTFTPLPSQTPLPSATFTEIPVVTAVVFAPTPAVAPLGERPELTLTAQGVPSLVPLFTPSPISSPATLAPLDVTPTFVTAAPGTEVVRQVTLVITPIGTAQFANITLTPIGARPSVTAITLTPISGNVQAPPTARPDPSARSYALSTVGGVNGSGFELPGGAASFSRNPQNQNQYVSADTRGVLYFVNDYQGGGGERAQFAPFSQFEPGSSGDNNARVTQLAWSPDGRYVAYLIDTDSDASTSNDSANDGVWFVDALADRATATDPSYMLLRDCPPEPGCAITNRPDAPYRYRSLSFAWNYQSSALLVRLQLPEEGRGGFAIVQPVADSNYASTRPPVLRYDDASWSEDGNSLITSGVGPDGRYGIWRVDRASGTATVLFDGSAAGLWVQDAIETPNGTVVALGSPNGAGGTLALYRADGTQLTDFIGSAAPIRVEWSPDRSAVLVVTNEGGALRYFIAEVGGNVDEITEDVAGALAVEWVQGRPPTTVNAAPTAEPALTPIPASGCVRVTAERLNVRAAPGTNDQVAPIVAVAVTGDILLITGEPRPADGLNWYPVLLRDGVTAGFATDRLGNVPFFTPSGCE